MVRIVISLALFVVLIIGLGAICLNFGISAGQPAVADAATGLLDMPSSADLINLGITLACIVLVVAGIIIANQLLRK